MDRGTVPEQAIRAFERSHALLVTVYDLGGRLQQFLDPERLQHRHAVCQAVKSSGQQQRCERYEVERVFRELRDRPDGRVHVCHAGVVEWAVPVLRGGRAELLLCAGARHPGRLALPVPRRPHEATAGLPPVAGDDADMILECLRQLASRLGSWLDDLGRSPFASRRADEPGDTHLVDRRARIERFIHQHHTMPVTLGALAAHLRLSPARASAAVRHCCGATFQHALRARRLATAADLLRHTSLAVNQIAIAAGFASRTHFTRAFTAHFGHAPRAYRLNHSG